MTLAEWLGACRLVNRSGLHRASKRTRYANPVEAGRPSRRQSGIRVCAPGTLKSCNRFDLKIHVGNELLLTSPLPVSRPKPERVTVSFLATRAHLEKIQLRVMVPDTIPGLVCMKSACRSLSKMKYPGTVGGLLAHIFSKSEFVMLVGGIDRSGGDRPRANPPNGLDGMGRFAARRPIVWQSSAIESTASLGTKTAGPVEGLPQSS